jgi:hypothetical protein
MSSSPVLARDPICAREEEDLVYVTSRGRTERITGRWTRARSIYCSTTSVAVAADVVVADVVAAAVSCCSTAVVRQAHRKDRNFDRVQQIGDWHRSLGWVAKTEVLAETCSQPLSQAVETIPSRLADHVAGVSTDWDHSLVEPNHFPADFPLLDGIGGRAAGSSSYGAAAFQQTGVVIQEASAVGHHRSSQALEYSAANLDSSDCRHLHSPVEDEPQAASLVATGIPSSLPHLPLPTPVH